MRFEEERSTTSDTRGFGVLPFVTDDEGVIEVEMPFETGFDYQTWFGFATRATIGLVVWANENVVERESLAKQVVHAVQFAAGLITARQAGLVSGGDQHEAGGFEFFDEGDGFLVDFAIFQGQWSYLMLAFNPHRV